MHNQCISCGSQHQGALPSSGNPLGAEQVPCKPEFCLSNFLNAEGKLTDEMAAKWIKANASDWFRALI